MLNVYPEEISVAVELMEKRLSEGDESGYFFIIALDGDIPVGYVCFGDIPMTKGSYDLYWVVVDPAYQGKGIGRSLLENAESDIVRREGRLAYAETSGRELYASTRAFYTSCGYSIEATLKDFYASGDDKCVFSKRL